jgi:hypothetical protein
MTATLLLKEWRQHRWPLLILALLSWAIAALQAFGSLHVGTSGGVFEELSTNFTYLLPITGWMLSHFLIATEFRHKSQLFLEGLPLPRWRMIAVKCAIALGFSAMMAVGSILIGWWIGGPSTAMTPRFFGILALSATAWSALVCSFFFLTAFLGRYRVAVHLFLLILLMFLIGASAVPVGDFPPFALLARLGSERDVWPVANLLWTALLVTIFIALSFLLGLIREGSVASMMGEKMSYREKIFFGAVVVGLLMLVSSQVQPEGEPFDLPGALSEETHDIKLFISPEDPTRVMDVDALMAMQLAKILARHRDWMGIDRSEFPAVYLVERSDLKAAEIKAETIDDEPVVLLFANYRAEGFSTEQLAAEAMIEALEKRTYGRITKEDRAWIADGVKCFWQYENAPPELLREKEQQAAAAVIQHGFDLAKLKRWGNYAETAGEENSELIAWMGMRRIAEKQGVEVLQNMARGTIGRAVKGEDARAAIHDLFHPITRSFEETTGHRLPDFVREWKAYILARQGKPEETTTTQ